MRFVVVIEPVFRLGRKVWTRVKVEFHLPPPAFLLSLYG